MKNLTFLKLFVTTAIAMALPGEYVLAEQTTRVINARFRNLEEDEEEQKAAEDFSVPIISVRTKGPKTVESDEPATYEIKVRNVSSKKDAKVDVLISYSKECRFISASPEPDFQDEGQIGYEVASLARLSDENFKLMLLPPEAGEINVNVVCKLQADNALETVVKRPSLRFDVNAPPFGRIGEKIPFEFTVMNMGDGVVRDARLYAELPEGMYVEKDSEKEMMEAFSIAGGKKKKIQVELIAQKSGIRDIRFRLLMGNVSAQTIQSTLCVTQPTTDVHLVGPAQHSVGLEGDYSLIVENNNQNAIEDAELDLEIPASLKITKVSRYADYYKDAGGRAHLRWPIREIKPGKRMMIRLRAEGLHQRKSDCKIEVYYPNGTKKISEYTIDVVDDGGASAPVESARNIDLTTPRTGALEITPVQRVKLNR